MRGVLLMEALLSDPCATRAFVPPDCPIGLASIIELCYGGDVNDLLEFQALVKAYQKNRAALDDPKTGTRKKAFSYFDECLSAFRNKSKSSDKASPISIFKEEKKESKEEKLTLEDAESKEKKAPPSGPFS